MSKPLSRRHEFWFEIPNIEWGLGELKIGQHVVLASVKRSDSPLWHVAESPSDTDFFIRITCNTHASKGGGAATTAAISTLKQFIVLARRAGVLTKAGSYEGLMSDAGEPMDQASCHVVDLDSPKRRFVDANIPERMNNYLRLVSLDADAFAGKASKGKGYRDAETQDKRARALFSRFRVLDCPESIPDALRIKTALDWEFEATQASDETVEFVQTCIALEALLGDNRQDEPLAARLADRCAYLLGKVESERDKIRRQFRRMYEARSKLVHGRKARLEGEESKQLQVAQRLLRAVSDREIANLVSSMGKSEIAEPPKR